MRGSCGPDAEAWVCQVLPVTHQQRWLLGLTPLTPAGRASSCIEIRHPEARHKAVFQAVLSLGLPVTCPSGCPSLGFHSSLPKQYLPGPIPHLNPTVP